MRVLNAYLMLKRVSHVILLVLTHGLVKYVHIQGKMSGHDSVHHAPQCTNRMTAVCKNSRKT